MHKIKTALKVFFKMPLFPSGAIARGGSIPAGKYITELLHCQRDSHIISCLLLLFAIPAFFVGNQACEPCHAAIVKAYSGTPMAISSGHNRGRLTPGSFRHAPSGVRYDISDSGLVKFSKDGEIKINAKLQGIDDNRVTILTEVIDEGIGIEKEKHKVIFEPFSQIEHLLTRKYGGTGLGLSIAKKLVNMMHGDIGVESEPGKGSRFYFTVLFEAVQE